MDNNNEKKNDLPIKKTYSEFDYMFELKINDDIICQRYFNINRFNPISLKSINFKEQFDTICTLIQDDLSSKTRIYLFNVCCTYAKEEDLLKKQKKGQNKSEIYSPLHDEFKVDSDKSVEENEEVNELTFTFLHNSKVIMKKSWDANIYPQFIRKNIDLANHQYIQVTPTYRLYFNNSDDDRMKYEHQLKKKIFMGRQDLIPQIITLFRDVCSMEDCFYKFYF